MKVYIFSENTALEKAFLGHSSATLDVGFYPCSELRKLLKSIQEPLLVYLDIKDRDYQKDLAYLLKKENVFTGILDPLGTIDDYNDYLLHGAVDYLDRDRVCNTLNYKHLKKVEHYLEKYRRDYQPPMKLSRRETLQASKHIRVSGWEEIQPGQEHSFYLLYAELDGRDELEKKYNKANLETALAVFRKYLERHLLPYNGRIWMWNGFGGVALFPYDGKSCAAVLSGFRIMLYRFLHYAEESMFPQFVSFRLALHLGDFVYQEEQTGNIISDTLNSLFHLGKLFTREGDFTLTEEIMSNMPPQLENYFIPAGEFEKRRVFRMRLPIFSGE